ncbi:metal ABC transporter permease [Trueperella pecoris]|uniref:Metal ABC transporter permease n=1 Tax=Trueperella pecoris TaxID=2733571 RepID=A0A7M1QSD5_9ACTO|nr:metal ABC transporter permease [Trueperella pecoris]QOQ38744.1 metal ABC transporter permease [Trueperella pecoris]QOR44763.1 metal ABC transporter permease [Trueperella pecoris]QTG74686.1 metal ABC transporter permease [Trueperella pecoris]
MSFILSVMLLAVVTSVVCSLPGVFLVLRRQSMLVDALSHAVLPGIVLGALISGSTHSPVMTVIATLCGLLIVIGADRLKRTGLLAGDANQGVIYPALFALGVLLLSTQLSGVHICADTVLVGDLNLMALETEHLIVGGFDIGPRMMWVLISVGALNAAFIVVAYRVLQATTFDKSFAAVSGMPVKIVDTVFMVLIALTVVTAFNVAGAILVITLMVVPAATAVLIAGTLPALIGQTIGISVFSGLVGFLVAWQGDLATTPMMAFVDGVMFCLVLLASRMLPRRLARDAG